MASALSLQSGSTLAAGRYRLVERLGSGSSGTVYLAIECGGRWQRQVALKVLCAPAASAAGLSLIEARRRLRAEVALLIRCQPHPHWVNVLADHTAATPAFFVMEYLPASHSLAALLQRATQAGRAVPLEDCRAYFVDVCAALVHLHEQVGALHRDLKLENILLVPTEGRLRAKLIDLGCAHDPRAPLTAAASVLGTPLYQAPELFEVGGKRPALQPGIDLFALGVALFSLLAGAYPFATAAQILDPDEPAAALPPERHLPTPWQSLLARLLQKDPTQRYSRAAAVAADLRRLAPPVPCATAASGKGARCGGMGLWAVAIASTLATSSLAAGWAWGTKAFFQQSAAGAPPPGVDLRAPLSSSTSQPKAAAVHAPPPHRLPRPAPAASTAAPAPPLPVPPSPPPAAPRLHRVILRRASPAPGAAP